MGDISVKLRKEFTRQVWTMFEGGKGFKGKPRGERGTEAGCMMSHWLPNTPVDKAIKEVS